MRSRLSARLILTLLTTTAVTIAVALIVEVTRQSLESISAQGLADTIEAAWTVGVLFIATSAIVSWFVAGTVTQPLNELRRTLGMSARTRALAEPIDAEFAEIRALRHGLATMLEEMDGTVRGVESEKRRLLSMFEAINEGIVQLGPGSRFVHVNAGARALLSLPANAEGQPASTLIRHPELRELLERAARGEAVAATEILLDGRQLLIAPHPLPGPYGEAGGAVMTVVELTELRRLESVRRDFVANVSHELKTPLTSIRGYTETLMSDELPRETQLQFLEVVYKNTTRIQRIVDELLDLSRLQSGGWTPEIQSVDVSELARDVWLSCEDNAERKSVRFSINGSRLPVLADEGGLRQVLSNLFENAIRYTNDGGQVHLTVSSRNDPAYVRPMVEIEVRDTGVGIPRDALPRIFERFFRVDPSRAREQGGTGLGLSIVKHLVDRMAGDVSAESELGKGTSIRVRLPAAPVS